MAKDFIANFIQQKIARFSSGESLRILDLFSGCGGLSLGFHKAGYKIIAGVELDKEAAHSHALNFHKGDPHFEQHAKSRDIQETSPDQLFKEIGLTGSPADQIDMIIGGPPCQAFTRIGRAKLRETSSDAMGFLKDARSQLYKKYLEYVRLLAPLSILMENVPDMLNYGGVNIAELVCEDLSKLGYKCRYTLLNSVHYGIPQMRERMFLIAIHESIDSDIKFPDPTNFAELPRGYHGSRNVALKHIHPGLFNRYYEESPKILTTLPSFVSAEQALSDLPEIVTHLQNKLKRGAKKLDVSISYKSEPQNQYQKLMREWPGFLSNGVVDGNVIRFLPRDYPIFRKMKPGDQYPQAIEVANKILESKLKKEEQLTGRPISKNSKRFKEIKAETIPPYAVDKFPNKWRKMEADLPARTLMAHLGKDSYSHIHYDSHQARPISVREAARLQSFPDKFQFSGAMNAAFRQIGNAVPPLMANKLAQTIRKTIRQGIKCSTMTN